MSQYIHFFIHKPRNFPSALPSSIAETIPRNNPINDSTHETCKEWLLSYAIENNLSLASFLSLKAYKNNVKHALLTAQSSGDINIWNNENFVLFNIKGLRKSNTEYRSKVNYCEL